MSGHDGISAVKREPEDVSILSVDEEDAKSFKKRRVTRTIMHVVVPTLREVNQKRRAAADFKQEVDLKPHQIKKLKHEGIKVKKGLKGLCGLRLDTINDRLEAKLGPPGQRDFDVDIDNEVKFRSAPRQFFSSTWGGNPQETFPTIGKEFLRKHGLNDFMYPNLLWNPHGPEIPGAAAIFFEPNGLAPRQEDSDHQYRVIVRLKEGPIWLYVGHYILLCSPSLTKDEWLMQEQKVRNTWAKEILRKGWGSHVRTRVALRKRLHRDPTDDEFEAALEAQAVPITQDDVRDAYDKGEECLGVYVLKCVGYDKAFQQKVFDDMKTWVPPPKREKKDRKREVSQSDKGSRPRKRKRVEDVLDSDTGDVFEHEEHEDGHQEIVPRGTKSRPKP